MLLTILMIPSFISFSQTLQDKPFCFTKEQAQYLARRKVVADYCDSLEIVYQGQLAQYKEALDVQGSIIVNNKDQISNLNKIIGNDETMLSDKNKIIVQQDRKVKRLKFFNKIATGAVIILGGIVLLM